MSQTVQLLAHSVLLLNGKVNGDFGEGWCVEGFIEGGEMKGKPNHVLLARSLSAVNDEGEAVVQVMNVGPISVTLYCNVQEAPSLLDTAHAPCIVP